ncbi:Sodium/hydrogen exchanger 2 [Zea mays]|uniref:Sodium/hydrogen exchanger 2 n=1 Tax=Zea mays TaxID=4577 RepID=A0A1D6IH31_MAIZE|nr:Sodium/hydrogen exchanger 2 [Zea mays]
MGLGAAMALGDPPADYASIAAVGLFVALMCVGIIVGHLLEENRWMNESITTLFIGLGTRAVILFASSEKHSRVLVFSEDSYLFTCCRRSYSMQGMGFVFQVKKKQFFRNFITITLFGAVGTLISFTVISLGALGLISRLNIGALELGDYLALGAIFSATDSNFDPGNISGAKLLNFISSFLYLFGSSTILGVASGLLSAYTIKKLYFGRHSIYREVSIMMLMAYLSYMLAEVIVWWAGLMRGVVSIALAYNKVNLVFGLYGLSFGLDVLLLLLPLSIPKHRTFFVVAFDLMFPRFCGSARHFGRCARHFGRDIIMPNLKSSVTTTASAVEYMDEVLKALPLGEARNEDSRTLQFNYGSFKHKALDKSLTKKEKTLAILHEFQVLQVVAVCECGLDYDRLQFCPTDMQKKFPGGVTHSFTDSTEDQDRLLSFEKMFIGVNGSSLKTNGNLEVVRGIPVERLMMETDSPYCDIINTHAGSQYVKSVWPSKKKEKYEPDSTVKGRNEPCLVREKTLAILHEFQVLHVVAVGECGLDYDRLQFCPADMQKKYFEKQFELAEAVKLPMFLHMCAVGEDLCEIMTRNLHRFPGGVTHSFTDSAEDRDRLLSFEKMFIGKISSPSNKNLHLLQHDDQCSTTLIRVEIQISSVENICCSFKYSILLHAFSVEASKQVLEVVAGSKEISDIEGLSRTLYHNTCRLFFPQDLDASTNAQLESGTAVQDC